MKTEQQAQDLAAKIVSYCRDHALGLNGLAAELEAGQPLDAVRAEALTHYCDQVQCLTLGGLVDQVWVLRATYYDQARIAEHVAYARQANWRHVRALKLGYMTHETTYVESRQLFMRVARQIKRG